MENEVINPKSIPGKKLVISELVSMAWHKMNGAKATIWLAVLIGFVINVVFEFIDYLTDRNFITGILSYIVSNLISMGVVLIGTRRALDLPIRASMLFEPFRWRFGLRLLLTIILFSIIVGIPAFLLFIFAALYQQIGTLVSIILSVIMFAIIIYLVVRMSLTFRIAVMQDVNPWHAIKLSFIATQQHFWSLLALLIVNFLIIVVSIIPIGIGLIWSIPYTIISWGIVYRLLVVAKQEAPEFVVPK